MRITRIRLQGVRRHQDLDIAPGPGLTVIRGPNEAGKSTIQLALEMAFFRKVTAAGKEMQDLRTWGATDDPFVELSFEHHGSPGRLTKRFAGQKGTVELEMDGQVLTDPGQVDVAITEMTGLPSEKFLRSTASIHHYELEGLDKDEGALRDRLQQSISGADQGTQAARRQLADVVRRYRSEGTRVPGLVRQVRTELDRLRAELAEGEAALSRLEADRTALALAHDRRAQMDAELAHNQDALDAGERAVRLETSATDAEARYMRLRQAVELQARITQGERDHPSSTPLPELRDGVRRLKDLQFQIQELESGLELPPDLSTVEVNAVKPPGWRPAGTLALVLLVAAGAVLAVSALTGSLPFLVGAMISVVLLVLGVGVGVWALRRRRSSRDLEGQVHLQEMQLERRRQAQQQDAEQLKQARRERDAILTSLGVPDVYAGDALLERQAAHSAAIDELRAEQRGILAGVAVSGDLAAERDRAAAEMDQSRHALSGLGGVAQDPAAARVRAQQLLAQTQQEREAAIQAEGQAQGRVDQNTIDAERVAALAESVEANEVRLAGLERRARIYESTLAAIERAEQRTVKIAARYLEEHMGEDVARITGGRYRRVQVNELDLAFTVWSPEAGDWVSVQRLSRGTLDQVYLAARLGLVRQVTQEQQPPLIFDDPFVTFDDDRAHQAAGLLRDLARDHQVFYLATSSRYDTVADAVIELPGPTLRDEVQDTPTIEPALPDAPVDGVSIADVPSEDAPSVDAPVADAPVAEFPTTDVPAASLQATPEHMAEAPVAMERPDPYLPWAREQVTQTGLWSDPHEPEVPVAPVAGGGTPV